MNLEQCATFNTVLNRQHSVRQTFSRSFSKFSKQCGSEKNAHMAYGVGLSNGLMCPYRPWITANWPPLSPTASIALVDQVDMLESIQSSQRSLSQRCVKIALPCPDALQSSLAGCDDWSLGRLALRLCAKVSQIHVHKGASSGVAGRQSR